MAEYIKAMNSALRDLERVAEQVSIASRLPKQ